MARKRRKPETEALQAAINTASDQARESGETYYVLREVLRLRYQTRPQSAVITPLPGDLEAAALACPDGRIVYL